METAVRPSLSGRTRIESLDGVRGIAVILVLAVHFQNMAVLPQTSAVSRWLSGLMSWGWSGVDLFLVLSGFLITGILLDTTDSEKRFQSFYHRRILRTFPLYYAVVLLSLAASVLVRHSNHILGPSPIGWVAYLLYVQNWWMPFGDPHHMEFLGPLWSLAIEEQFYLVWPLCVWRLSTRTLTKICSLGVLGAFLLRFGLTSHITPTLGFVVYLNTFTRMDALLVGGLCAIAVRDTVLLVRFRKLAPIALAAVASGLALIVFRGHDAWNDPDVLVYGHLLLAIGFACLILLAYYLNGAGTAFDKTLCSKSLKLFGKYSYGIYVYQGLVLELTLHLFRHRPWWGYSIRNALLVAFAWVAGPFLIAFLSYHLFEKRFLRLSASSRAAL
jgi:peptidoglycan/LPS O-acetylase OafA/YrhL